MTTTIPNSIKITLENSSVTSSIYNLYEKQLENLSHLECEIRMMRNEKSEENLSLLPFYETALGMLLQRKAALDRVAFEHRLASPNWHPENGMD